MLHELHAWKRTWLCVWMYFHLKDAFETVQYLASYVSSYHWMFERPLTQTECHTPRRDGNAIPLSQYTLIQIAHTQTHLVHTGFFHPPKPIQCPPRLTSSTLGVTCTVLEFSIQFWFDVFHLRIETQTWSINSQCVRIKSKRTILSFLSFSCDKCVHYGNKFSKNEKLQ